MSRPSAPFLALLLALAIPAAAEAAPPQLFLPDRNATGTAVITKPITLQKMRDLDFGLVTVTTAGTAVLNPNTDAVTTTGGVLFAGGFPHSAVFDGISPIGNIVIIRLPRNPATVTRVGGTETMTVDNWTLDGSSRRTVPSRTAFTFKVGATLYVGANQVEGTYTGTFDVEVQYP